MSQRVCPNIKLPELEEEVLKYWKEHKIFEKTIESRPENKTWTFLDGPPFVTGMPHYGSLLSSLPKDLFGRYWTMKGYRVRRVWGWDGHGLPIENKVENELQITRKKDIEEKVGIGEFIKRCLSYVNQVSGEWEWYVDHIGRWVDFKHAYKTWDIPYMESVMWVFKQMYEKGHIYKGLRVSLYCPHCETPISNFEVAMDADNHKEVTDAATTYKYPLNGEKDTFILAWSTTPWTKIVTPALAVNPDLVYVKVQQGKEKYILAKSTLKMLGDESYKTLEEFKGKELIGKKFTPHYDYYSIEKGKVAFEIIGGDFVTADEGTGVVTIAAYGEEDLKVMKENNIHIETHLSDEGNVKENVPLFGGMYYLKANKFVNEDLGKRGLIYKDEQLPHVIPLCWRCHTRLYYAPMDAWYVNVQDLKDKMKATNEKVNWFPSHFKHGRFLKSLENAPDWNISRNRYWGSPVPVWECECGERFVPGSIQELEERSGKKITDLHKPFIDEVTVKCEKCGKTVHRVAEVLDSWIEAGSASFGERHYPFAKTEPLEHFYPPNFIAEYTGQIRAWFYVLHVIANGLDLLTNGKNYLAENVLVEGVILGTDGRKMSKNLKNYPDPKEMLQKYGGDALRLYLLSSSVMKGEDISISEDHYQQVRSTLMVLWNVYNFFDSNAQLDNWKYKNTDVKSSNVLDQWILSLLQVLIGDVTKALDDYDTVTAIEKLKSFIDQLSTWYIRRSRERVGLSSSDEEKKNEFYSTTYDVLTTVCKLMAPIAPFISEAIYRNLTDEESVHLADWPEANKDLIDKNLEEQMSLGRKIVEIGLSLRKENKLKVRQPFGLAFHDEPKTKLKNAEVLEILLQELNLKSWTDESSFLKKDNIITKEEEGFTVAIDATLTYELKKEGQARDIIRSIQEERKRIGTALDESINVTLPDWPVEFEEEIKKKTLIDSLKKGENFSVERK